MTSDDLTRRAIIAAHDAGCDRQCGEDALTFRRLTSGEQAIVALWRDDRDAFGKANKRVCELEIELLKMQEAGRNTIKRAETAEAAADRVRDMHRPHRIYDECGHQHEYNYDDGSLPGGVVEIAEIGLVCEGGYLYSVCRECCTDPDGFMASEECADTHSHKPGEAHHCRTVAALDGTEGADA